MRGVSCEATLMFPKWFDCPNGSIESDLAVLAEAHDAALSEIPCDDRRFRLFEMGALQILLALPADPLDPAHFLDASRPPCPDLADTEILRRLTGHRCAMTVLVADNPDLSEPDTEERRSLRQRLCWQLVETLRAEGDASLVFWCPNDTLYASSEFGRANLFGDGPGSFDAFDGVPAHTLNMKTMIENKALTFMQAQIVQGAHRADPMPSQTRRSGLLPPGGIRAVVEACSAAILVGAVGLFRL